MGKLLFLEKILQNKKWVKAIVICMIVSIAVSTIASFAALAVFISKVDSINKHNQERRAYFEERREEFYAEREAAMDMVENFDK